MTRKNSCTMLFLSLLLVLSACSTTKILEKKWVGKKMPSSQIQMLNDSGHHTWKRQHLDIEYDYSTDFTAKTMNFKGTMQYNISIDKSSLRSEMILQDIVRCELRLLFADREQKVVGVKVFNIFPGTNIFDPFPFEVTVPYKDNYYWLCFGYFLYSEGT